MKTLIRFWNGNQHMANALVDNWPSSLKEWDQVFHDAAVSNWFHAIDMPRNHPTWRNGEPKYLIDITTRS